MKKTVLIAIIAIAATACIFACRPMYPEIDTAVTLIEIKVVPPDAAVIIDGKLYGNAWDLDKIELHPGLRTIEIRKKGYQPYKKDHSIGYGPQLIEVELTEIE